LNDHPQRQSIVNEILLGSTSHQHTLGAKLALGTGVADLTAEGMATEAHAARINAAYWNCIQMERSYLTKDSGVKMSPFFTPEDIHHSTLGVPVQSGDKITCLISFERSLFLELFQDEEGIISQYSVMITPFVRVIFSSMQNTVW